MIATLLVPALAALLPGGVRAPPPSLRRAGSPVAALATGAPAVPFEEWAEENSINAPKLAITGVEDLRGVIAIEDVAAGEEICMVPRTACLDLAAVEGAGSPCEALVPSSLWVTLRWFERLACWLIAEQRRGEASPVSGYMSYLPRPASFANAPLSWSDEQLAELRYPPLAASIREQAAELGALHASLQRSGSALAPSVTLEELRWAHQLVLSRAFTSTIATEKEIASKRPPPPPPPPTPSQTAAKMWFGGVPVVNQIFNEPPPPPPPPPAGDGLDMAMMPMLDAFNHVSGAANTCAYDGQRNAFVLTARGPLRKGEQAFLSYGDKSNDELLQLFGFVEEENPHDAFLSIGLDAYVASCANLFASETEMGKRFDRLALLGYDDDPLLAELRAGGAPAQTLHALRVMVGTSDEVSFTEDLRALVRPKSLQTEERVWSVLMGYCKMARAAMGGSRKSDLAAVSQARKGGDERRVLALTLRAEKKRLLSELERRTEQRAARSRKAGKVVK